MNERSRQQKWDGIVNSMADAFTNIEKQDRRVDKITLTSEKMYDLRMHDCHVYGIQDGIWDFIETRPIGQFWGAPIEIGAENKVTSQRNYYTQAITAPIKFALGFIKSNLTILVKSRAKPLYRVESNEWTAINTLREMITEADFRKYMKHGFILVKGASGKIYQIFRTNYHTKVWESGRVIEEICVRIKDTKIPPTDNLIAFKTIIECNEEDFKNLGNVYKMKQAA